MYPPAAINIVDNDSKKNSAPDNEGTSPLFTNTGATTQYCSKNWVRAIYIRLGYLINLKNAGKSFMVSKLR